jgi:hypothetical protein
MTDPWYGSGSAKARRHTNIPAVLRVLSRLTSTASRTHNQTATALNDFVPVAVAIGYDRNPQYEIPLWCSAFGPVAGSRVRIAALFGGGLHTAGADGRKLEAVAPARPNEPVLLSRDGGLPRSGPHGERRWHYPELRAAGFSPSG